jgi:hypothetical protein
MDLAAQDFGLVELTGITLDDLDAILSAVAGDEPERTVSPAIPLRDEWGVPILSLAQQPVDLVEPVRKWGTTARTGRHEGLYHFYTDDAKFRGLLREPSVLVATGCRQAVELNLTTSASQPRALQLYRIYQKRSVAVAWQRAGLQVWVDLNVDPSCFELNLLGVPTGWWAYANRGYAAEAWHLERAYELARHHAGRDPLYLVYGGGRATHELCQTRGWLWVADDGDSSRGRADGTR